MCQFLDGCPFTDCNAELQSHFNRPASTEEVEGILQCKWWIRPGVIVRWRNPSPAPMEHIVPDAPGVAGRRMVVRSINVVPSVIDPGEGGPLKCVQHVWLHLAPADDGGQA